MATPGGNPAGRFAVLGEMYRDFWQKRPRDVHSRDGGVPPVRGGAQRGSLRVLGLCRSEALESCSFPRVQVPAKPAIAFRVVTPVNLVARGSRLYGWHPPFLYTTLMRHRDKNLPHNIHSQKTRATDRGDTGGEGTGATRRESVTARGSAFRISTARAESSSRPENPPGCRSGRPRSSGKG